MKKKKNHILSFTILASCAAITFGALGGTISYGNSSHGLIVDNNGEDSNVSNGGSTINDKNDGSNVESTANPNENDNQNSSSSNTNDSDETQKPDNSTPIEPGEHVKPEESVDEPSDERWWLSKTDRNYLDMFKNAFESNDVNEMTNVLNSTLSNSVDTAATILNTFFRTSENITNQDIDKSEYVSIDDIEGVEYGFENGSLITKILLKQDSTATKLYFDYTDPKGSNETATYTGFGKEIKLVTDLRGKKIFFKDDDVLGSDYDGEDLNISQNLSDYSLAMALGKQNDGSYRLYVVPKVITDSYQYKYLGSITNVYGENGSYIRKITDGNWWYSSDLNLEPSTGDENQSNNGLKHIEESVLIDKYNKIFNDDSKTFDEKITLLGESIFTNDYSFENRQRFAQSVVKSNLRTHDDYKDNERPFAKMVKDEQILGITDFGINSEGDIEFYVKFSGEVENWEYDLACPIGNGKYIGQPLRQSRMRTTIKMFGKEIYFVDDLLESEYELKHKKVPNASNYGASAGIYKENGQYFLLIENKYTNEEGQVVEFDDSYIDYDLANIPNVNTYAYKNISFSIPLSYAANSDDLDLVSGDVLKNVSSFMNDKEISTESKAKWMSDQYKKLDSASKQKIAQDLVRLKLGTWEDRKTEEIYERCYPAGVTLLDISWKVLRESEILYIEDIWAEANGAINFTVKLARSNGALLLNEFGHGRQLGDVVSGDQLRIALYPMDGSDHLHFIDDRIFSSDEDFYNSITEKDFHGAAFAYGLVRKEDGSLSVSLSSTYTSTADGQKHSTKGSIKYYNNGSTRDHWVNGKLYKDPAIFEDVRISTFL